MLLQGAAQAGALIPEQIKAPTGYKSVLTVHAKGEQIYQCTVKQGEYTWETQAPDAQLFDDQGKLVGNVHWNQVAAGRQHLSKFYKDRAKRFECKAQTQATRHGRART